MSNKSVFVTKLHGTPSYMPIEIRDLSQYGNYLLLLVKLCLFVFFLLVLLLPFYGE